jgi:hypothetical protein
VPVFRASQRHNADWVSLPSPTQQRLLQTAAAVENPFDLPLRERVVAQPETTQAQRDVAVTMQQAGVTREEAEEALRLEHNDLVGAIVRLTVNREPNRTGLRKREKPYIEYQKVAPVDEERALVCDVIDALNEENCFFNCKPMTNFFCSITNAAMRNPVQDLEGHSYEHAAIKRWFLQEGRYTSPNTGRELDSPQLKVNVALRGTMEEWVDNCVDMYLEGPAKWREHTNPKSKWDRKKKLKDFLEFIQPTKQSNTKNVGTQAGPPRMTPVAVTYELESEGVVQRYTASLREGVWQQFEEID